MSLSRWLVLLLGMVALLNGARGYAADGGIGCPATHNGKPLKGVGLFDGPPSELGELMPQPGRFVINEGDTPASRTLPYFTLGCTYRGSPDVVTVILPRHIRVCDFHHYPKLNCH